MTERLTITQFNPSESVDLIELWNLCGLTTPQNDPSRDIERKLLHGDEYFLVGRVEKQLVASVMGGYDGHRGWVNYLAVAPQYQRHGFGALIMQSLESRLLEAGCAKINLQVRASNQSVLEFYRSLGFVDDAVVSLGKRLIIDEPFN